MLKSLHFCIDGKNETFCRYILTIKRTQHISYGKIILLTVADRVLDNKIRYNKIVASLLGVNSHFVCFDH